MIEIFLPDLEFIKYWSGKKAYYISGDLYRLDQTIIFMNGDQFNYLKEVHCEIFDIEQVGDQYIYSLLVINKRTYALKNIDKLSNFPISKAAKLLQINAVYNEEYEVLRLADRIDWINGNVSYYVKHLTCEQVFLVEAYRIIRSRIKCICQHGKAKLYADLKQGESVILSSEYRVWAYIKHVTRNVNHKQYQAHVLMDENWQKSFFNFLADVGQKPDLRYQLKRHNPEGDYCKENCEWKIVRSYGLKVDQYSELKVTL